MRVLVVALLLVIAFPGRAQAPSPQSISIGEVPLVLGIPKDAALSKLREVFDVSEAGNDTFLIQKKGHAENEIEPYGSVSFRKGSLSSVEKDWTSHGLDSGVDIVNAIYGSVSSKSPQICAVTTFEEQEPNPDIEVRGERRGVLLTCGQRHIDVYTIRYRGSDGDSRQFPVVNETLGEP